MISVLSIQRAVALAYKVPLRIMDERDGVGTRTDEHVRPRQVAMALSREMIAYRSGGSNISFAHIGRRFGNRDHSTVIHAIRTVKRLCLSDPQLRNNVDSLSVGLLLVRH